MIERILNLGCGNELIEGAINHDRVKHRSEIDIIWDLNELSWPWEDNYFDTIAARAVLEHLEIDLIKSVSECWRILKPGGKLWFKLPYWKHENSYSDPTHRWFCNLETPTIFDPETPYGAKYKFYFPRKWKIIKGPLFNSAKSSILTTMVKIL